MYRLRAEDAGSRNSRVIKQTLQNLCYTANNDKTHSTLGKVPCHPACSRDEKENNSQKATPPFRALESLPPRVCPPFIQLLLVDKSSECWSPGPSSRKYLDRAGEGMRRQ